MGDQPETKAGKAASDPGSDAPTDRVDGVPAYRVELPVFEGPLDLLLHLIQQHELDIFDIPIAFVTQKYVEYVTLMRDLNIDVASEYLVMAATLTHIKSKMLLPASPDDEDEEDDIELDPRAELVRRLLEYQKYKQAAEQLGDRSILGRDIFTRGAPAPSIDGPAALAPVGLFKLLDAFQAVLKRVKQTADHQIDVDRFSISDRINELSDILRVRHRVDFEELFSRDQTRGDLIVTFLALLEMTRIRLIRLTQTGPLEPISIELAVSEGLEDEPLGSGLDGYTPDRGADGEFEHAESGRQLDNDAGAESGDEFDNDAGAESGDEFDNDAGADLGAELETDESPESDSALETAARPEPDASSEPDARIDGPGDTEPHETRGSAQYASETGPVEGNVAFAAGELPADLSDVGANEVKEATPEAVDRDAAEPAERRAETEGQTETN
jgi:segregation and condensation protein A